MRYFLAVNNKQLGICLRMLYAKKNSRIRRNCYEQ